MKKHRFFSMMGVLLWLAGTTLSCGGTDGDVISDESDYGSQDQSKDDQQGNDKKDDEQKGECKGADCEKTCEGTDCEKTCEGEDCEKTCEGADCEKTGDDDNVKQPPAKDGPIAETEVETDDSDVLEGVTLPQPRALPDDPCLKCTNTQECFNNACRDSTTHSVSVKTAFTVEDGDVTSFTVHMSRKPEADIHFECWIVTTSPVDEASIECDSIIKKGDFTNYEHSSSTSAVPINVKGLPDNIDDGDQKYYVMLKTISDDPYFNDIVHSPMEFTNRNIDHAGVVCNIDKNMLTSESGDKATYTLALATKPLAPVKLKLHSSDITEGTVEPKTMVFTPDNWNKPQTVTVTGVDDEYADKSIDYAILTKAVSVDPKYNNIDIKPIQVTNIDDDFPNIAVSLNDYKLTPNSNKTKMAVSISTEPQSEVTVKLQDYWQYVKFEPESVVFDRTNWKEPQTFTVIYDDPTKVPSARTETTLIGYAVSEDKAYNEKISNRLQLDLYRYETIDFDYTGKEASINLVPGEYKLQVWGSQGHGELNSLGGYGGYSYGTYNIKEATTLYVNVGGMPYNGGGAGQAKGGGATHIATVSGVLSKLSSQRDNVLIVAGGGGGSERTPGGYGGGETGGPGNKYNYTTKIPTGGTQTAGGELGQTSRFGNGEAGSFGQGGSGNGTTECEAGYVDSGAGGGGGWFGGGGIPYAGGGGGGSGHLSSEIYDGRTIAGSGEETFESPTGGDEPGHAGTGFARISVVERIPYVVY